MRRDAETDSRLWWWWIGSTRPEMCRWSGVSWTDPVVFMQWSMSGHQLSLLRAERKWLTSVTASPKCVNAWTAHRSAQYATANSLTLTFWWARRSTHPTIQDATEWLAYGLVYIFYSKVLYVCRWYTLLVERCFNVLIA